MTARQLLLQAVARLEHAGCDTPRLDAETLLMAAWGIDKAGLIIRMHDVPPANVATRFDEWLVRRADREPVAYIVGHKEFWSREFRVDARVLIPRPETEHLIEELIRYIPERGAPYRFCDIGTGSGCIAVTIACEYPKAEIVATDLSADALAVARANAERHGVSGRIAFRQGDLFAALHASDGPFDAILSNPPYVSRDEMAALAPELHFEPAAALTDEADGLSHLTTMGREACRWLKPGGLLMVETGLCGLPEVPEQLVLLHPFRDLADKLRGGIYRFSRQA